MGKKSSINIRSISNISGGTINIAGRDVIQDQNDSDIELLQELIVLLSEIRELVYQSGLDEKSIRVIDSNLQLVQSQLGTKKPSKTTILRKLWSVAEAISTASGAVTGVQMLTDMTQRAIDIANSFLK